MTYRDILINTIRKLDKYSPYPLFYPFKMSKNEKILFDEAIKKTQNYLEFGFGGSSLRAIQKSKAKIFTVESSPEWIKYMREYLIVRYFENRRLFIFPVNIGPTRKWGYPELNNSINLFESYSSDIFKLIDCNTLDLALVDGRFRVACTLKLILECHKNNNLKILFHDFWDRDQYHVVLKYLDIVDKVDTMGHFSIKKDINLKSVEIDYETYKINPS